MIKASLGERLKMRQFIRHETLLTCAIFFVLLPIAFPPLGPALPAATIADRLTPIISQFPQKLGKFGGKYGIRVHAAGTNALRQVSLVLMDGEKPVRGKMSKLLQEGQVPVRVKTTLQTPLYVAAKPNAKVITKLPAGEVLDVSQVINSFYRVVSASGKKGFIRAEDTEVQVWGEAYSVSLPESMTKRSQLKYHIEAVDAQGNKSSTEDISVRFLTADEIQDLLAQLRGGEKLQQPKTKVASEKPKVKMASTKPKVKMTHSGGGGSLLKKPVVWAGAAVAGGLAYFILSEKDEEENLATLNVLVEWE